jgi:hypothetical protein
MSDDVARGSVPTKPLISVCLPSRAARPVAKGLSGEGRDEKVNLVWHMRELALSIPRAMEMMVTPSKLRRLALLKRVRNGTRACRRSAPNTRAR